MGLKMDGFVKKLQLLLCALALFGMHAIRGMNTEGYMRKNDSGHPHIIFFRFYTLPETLIVQVGNSNEITYYQVNKDFLNDKSPNVISKYVQQYIGAQFYGFNGQEYVLCFVPKQYTSLPRRLNIKISGIDKGGFGLSITEKKYKTFLKCFKSMQLKSLNHNQLVKMFAKEKKKIKEMKRVQNSKKRSVSAPPERPKQPPSGFLFNSEGFLLQYPSNVSASKKSILTQPKQPKRLSSENSVSSAPQDRKKTNTADHQNTKNDQSDAKMQKSSPKKQPQKTNASKQYNDKNEKRYRKSLIYTIIKSLFSKNTGITALAAASMYYFYACSTTRLDRDIF